MYVKRTLEQFIVHATEHFPVLLLTGARQVGKTTLLQKMKESGRAYVNLDDPIVQSLAREAPALFRPRFLPAIVFFLLRQQTQLFRPG